MTITDTDLAVVRDLLSNDQAIPAIIVRGIVARLDGAESAVCRHCGALYFS